MAVADRLGRGPSPGPVGGRRLRVPGLGSLATRGWTNPWVLVCGGVCVVVGVAAGVKPEYGLLAALGLLFAVVAITDLTLGFVLFVVASFMDQLSASGSFSGTKVIGLVVFVAWLARIGTRRGIALGQFMHENPGLAYALVLMLFWSAVSFIWASNPGAALGGTGRYALVMMIVPIAFDAARRDEQAIWVIAAFVVGAVLSAVYGFAASSVGGGRFLGANGDPNGEATVLATAIPLLVALYPTIRRSAALKLAAAVGMLFLLLGLVETLSREGLLELAAILVGAVVFGGRWRGKAAQLLVLGVVVIGGYYAILAPASSTQRVTMSDTSGRTSLWTVGIRVFDAHPLLGVGNDNFIDVEAQYLNRPGAITAFYLVTSPHVSHNTYLEAAADLGIPGLVTLLAVVGLCLRAGVRAARIFERVGDEQMELLSRGLVLSIVGVLTASFFVAGNYEKFLWIPLAMGPVLQSLAYRAANQPSPAKKAASRRHSAARV